MYNATRFQLLLFVIHFFFMLFFLSCKRDPEKAEYDRALRSNSLTIMKNYLDNESIDDNYRSKVEARYRELEASIDASDYQKYAQKGEHCFYNDDIEGIMMRDGKVWLSRNVWVVQDSKPEDLRQDNRNNPYVLSIVSLHEEKIYQLLYNNDPESNLKYGILFDGVGAISSDNKVCSEAACPLGWRIPTSKEWKDLIDLYGGPKEILKDRSEFASKFNLVYGGFATKNGSRYLGENQFTYFWSKRNTSNSSPLELYYFGKNSHEIKQAKEGDFAYCRCIKDDI